MPIAFLSAAALLAAAAATDDFVCPVAGHAVTEESQAFFYGGVVTRICCAGCEGSLKGDAAKLLGAARKDGLVGRFLFDPVSGAAIKPADAAGHSDSKGIRYYFASAENKKAFDADPAKHAAVPDLEYAGSCAVTEEVIEPGKEAAFRDVVTTKDGKKVVTRYYFACPNCSLKFDKDPSEFTAKAKPAKPAVREVK